MSRTTGRSCNCIAASPTAKLQLETARGIPIRASCTRAAALQPGFIHRAMPGEGTWRNYVGNNSERKTKDPETIEISAVFREPARPAGDAAFRGFPVKRRQRRTSFSRRSAISRRSFDAEYSKISKLLKENAGARG